MIKFPYYSGNIYNSKCLGYVSLDDFIKTHKTPSDKTRDILNQIHNARISGNVELKRKLKTKLHAFTPSVMINVGEKRQYSNITSFTQLLQIDLDKIPTEQKAIDLKEHIFHNYEEIVCSYISPSKKGIKALMRIKEIKFDTSNQVARDEAIKNFKAIHKAIEYEFEQYEYFDPATKNAILPLFLSHDPKILFRSFDNTVIWDIEDWSEPEYVNLVDEPKKQERSHTDIYYYKKVIEITQRRINSIVDNGHPQVRNTALVLGSRVGAGYISRSEAEHLIENLIKSNNYLQKGISGYVKTALWGINQGISNPKFFNI